ncbi:MAG: Uncharacterized protein Athens071425_605 [Parcubacteria group bacterium Athens0714_25]|nr:MAG: Uncharacterized protein Athens071425_605 [Parcubacteria group bacterium Athens0714_25]
MSNYRKTKNNKSGIRKVDGVGTDPRVIRFFETLKSKEFNSLLYSKGRISQKFFTEDSGLYITPKQAKLFKLGVKLNTKANIFDGLSSRIVSRYKTYQPNQKGALYARYARLVQRYFDLEDNIKSQSKNFFGNLSFVKVYNFSLIGAILVGMFTMSFIYQYLGSSASARGNGNDSSRQAAWQEEAARKETAEVLSNGTKEEKEDEWNEEKESQYISQMVDYLENAEKEKTEKEIEEMVKGYPIEKMLPYILEQDRTVAAFLISIAKKESNWGKRVPVLDGQDCYNYWGYRGQRKLMGTGGHTCFNSRKDAVDTVAKRIQWLVKNKKLNTPEKMVIWKCGSDCNATGGQEAARKWISDVNMYFKKLNY